MTDINTQVDRLIDTRGGKELLHPPYDEEAVRFTDVCYRSAGSTSAYMLLTGKGRVIVNTGLGYEAVHHRSLFDRICPGPTPYIITTQAHTDHVGGVAVFREPGSTYVAQRENLDEQHADARIRGRMQQWASVWFDLRPAVARQFAAERPDLPMGQDAPTPDLTFEERLGLRVDDLEIELWHGNGETTDGAIVWLPQHRTALISNMLGPLFGHFPNLNTVRGHKYRFVEPYLATIRRLRELRPEVLVTGRGDPIEGADLIDACLQRMYDAVTYVHDQTLRGINERAELSDLIHEVRLPDHLRVGEGYGRVAWGVRTIWESYLGWFHHDGTAPLLSVDDQELRGELAALAGADAVLNAAREDLETDDPAKAIGLVEALLAHEPDHAAALRLLIEAHEAVAKQPEVDANFWLSGWVEHHTQEIRTALAAADEAGR